jgi:hypothetical protein
VDDETEIGSFLEFGSQGAGRGIGLHGQHGPGGQSGQHQRVGVLVIRHRARLVAVEIEGAEPDCANLEWKPEDRPDAGRDRRRGERQPPGRARIDQVGLEDGPVLQVGVDTGPFTEGVLQFLDQSAHVVAGAQRTLLLITRHEHDAGTAHERDIGADLAQPGRSRFRR